MEMKRRHVTDATSAFADPNEWVLLGYAYDLDVYMAHPSNVDSRGKRPAAVVCDKEQCDGLNWTMLTIKDGNITPLDNDVPIPLPHLVEIYELITRYTEQIT
jgi:hypothetical protein